MLQPSCGFNLCSVFKVSEDCYESHAETADVSWGLKAASVTAFDSVPLAAGH